jgi:hypothetical protein
VIVTVVTMRVMQVAVNKVVNMVAVRDGFVTAAWSVNVACLVSGAMMIRSTDVRILLCDFQDMLFDLTICLNVVQMSIMQVVHMIAVLDTRVLAIWTMLMVVMSVQCRHSQFSDSRFQG